MYLIDTNILVYATDAQASHHGTARNWLDSQLSGHAQSVGMPWHSLLGFIRLTTNPRIYSPPARIQDSWEQVINWLARPAAWIPEASPRHQYFLGKIIDEVQISANLLPDAHLAALAIEHGLTVVSADSDFAKFADVRWFNPLA